MRRFTVLVCLLFVLSAAPRAAETWTYAASDHFEVYATGGAGQAREALTYFERVHAFFTDFLKLSPRPGKPTRLIIFSSDKQFAPYRPNAIAAAFYLSGPDRDFIVMKSLDEEAYPIVVHEYSHLIVRHSDGTYPLWLNEGLAEFFSTMSARGDKMSIGTVPLGPLLHLRDGAALMALDRLFQVGYDSPEYNTRQHAGVFYAQSWALTHMLLTDARYRPQSNRFIKLVAQGTSSAAALTTVYGKTPDVVGRELNNYLRQSQFILLLANYKSPDQKARPVTRVADAFEAGLVTANLLANTPNRENEARAAFDQLAAQKPDDLTLLEARAYFELHRGHAKEALPYLARAVEQGTKKASVYSDYARLDPARAATLLPLAVSYAPDDLDIRLDYGSMLIRERKSAEAVTTLLPVKPIPEEFAFRTFHLLANAYMQLNQIEEAKSAAARAVRYAKPGDEASYAARLAKSIDDYAALRATAARRDVLSIEIPRGAALTPPEGSSSEAADVALESLARLRQEPPVIVAGRMRNMICVGQAPPILEIDTGSGRLRLLIDDRMAITVQGKSSFTADLTCGAQDVPIRIGYEPMVDAARKTVGLVRLLDYRP